MNARLLLFVAVLLGGCLASPGPVPGDDASSPAYEYHVFDHAGVDGAAIEGGIQYDQDGEYTTRYYVTTVESEDETERFDRSVLGAEARAFVANTSFDESYLVVVQAFPASSSPDYRVESVSREAGTLDVAVDDSSRARTSDITVETVLLRVEGQPPDVVTVRTEEGHTFDTAAGVVTVTPTATPTPEQSVDLPYASANESRNVAEPRDLRVTNAGDHANGYRVAVTASERPACRDRTPPCGQPERTVMLVEEHGKLRPGADRTWTDVVAQRGDYRVTVEAEVPDGDGSRRTVTETFTWHVDDDHGDAVITVTDEGVTVSQSADERARVARRPVV